MKRAPELPLSLRGVFHRTLTGVLSATILLLTLLAVSPSAHESIHAHAASADHVCAVTLYAQGVTSPLCYVEVPRPAERPLLANPIARPELRLVAPDYLFQPLRGPPVS